MRWVGKDEVCRAHQRYHKTIFKNCTLQPWTSVDIRAVTQDVGIATAIGSSDGFTGTDGRVYPPSTGVLTFVLVHRSGRWLKPRRPQHERRPTRRSQQPHPALSPT